ncbi:putative Avra10-like protein [Blumeria hordei DH14]|uniref:Putative Avra10-like protein n=1 Tax=Blumeria graminis f. sp. hordei (strain DH14) TaxID=546991 RepID=N1JJT8_BLUG1|nr:putative Avra10-like protein [Blumeria hordei DH14]
MSNCGRANASSPEHAGFFLDQHQQGPSMGASQQVCNQRPSTNSRTSPHRVTPRHFTGHVVFGPIVGNEGQEVSQIRVTHENLPRFALAETQWTHPPPVLDTVHKADEYAKDLCSGLTNAIKATGKRRNKRHGKCAPWWTPECKLARTEYRVAMTPEQRWIHSKKLRSTLRAARKEYQTRQVEAITTPTDVFKLMRTTEPRQASTPPPLNHDGKMCTDRAERAVILLLKLCR